MPALLAHSPTTNMKELGLERLQIMPCELLHDLKGVLSNSPTELERHLPAPAAQSYEEVIGVTVDRQRSRGCIWREAVRLLTKQATTWESCPQQGKALAKEPCRHLLDSLRRERRRNTKDGTEVNIASLAMFCPSSRNCRRLPENMLQRGFVWWLLP